MEKRLINNDVNATLSNIDEKIFQRTSHFVDELIKRRESLGWTQENLANESGLKQPAVARIEKMEKSGSVPKFDTLLKLVYAMGLDIKLVVKEDKTH
ncbi:helix-turn-helix domain-containing protein [Priestia aryabhattai]